MGNSLDWIYDIEDEYYAINKNKNYINISDWNNDRDYIEIASELLIKVSNISDKDYSKYYFIEYIDNIKDKFANYLFYEYELKINIRDILFVNNSTYALYTVCKSLKELNLHRALLVTPLYFSISHCLKEFGFETIYHHLLSENNFELNIKTFEQDICHQYIDVVFITNPIFCIGNNSIENKLYDIFDIIKKKDIWIVIDSTLDGMYWDKEVDIINKSIISEFINYKKIIYIDSITKKMFLNGLKHAIIISDLAYNTSIEYSPDYNIGSLTVNQIKLIEEVYKKENKNIIINNLKSNINLFKNNYLLCENLINNSDYYLANTTRGFHTSIIHKELKIFEVDQPALLKKLLFNHNVLMYPLEYFSFYLDNKFGFRINLSKHPYEIQQTLNSLLKIQL